MAAQAAVSTTSWIHGLPMTWPQRAANAKAPRTPRPTAISALRRYSKPSERKNRRSIAMPMAATASAATGSDSAQEPVAPITDSAMYPPHRK